MEGKNLSVALVEEGFATMHFTAERSSHYREISKAEENAKRKKDKVKFILVLLQVLCY